MTKVDFSRRNALTELMDRTDTDFETFRACLIDLAKVNRLTLAYRPTLSFFELLRRKGALPSGRPVTVLDVGCGSGDMLRKIDRWASRRRLSFDLVGIDLNPWAARVAEQVTARRRPIQFVTANIFDYSPSKPIDIIVSSLFTHHLGDDALSKFIAWMETHAQIGWFVNDLYRRALPYYFFRVFSRLARFHTFVQNDGPISIARAFDPTDWKRLLSIAAVPDGAAGIHVWFPYRICVARVKSA